MAPLQERDWAKMASTEEFKEKNTAEHKGSSQFFLQDFSENTLWTDEKNVELFGRCVLR